MLFQDLIAKDKLIRQQVSYQNDLIVNRIVEEYLSIQNEKNFSVPKTGDRVSDLSEIYSLVKGTGNGDLLETIMQKYHINYSVAIRNAIIHLFGRDSELYNNKISPLSFPGVYDVQAIDEKYQLNTILGTVTVSKASPLFLGTYSHYIFCNHLINKCFYRSYDFLCENRDNCYAVLSYMPYLFYGGHYHAYLELGSNILDIASNSFYFSKEDSNKVLNGKVLKKLTYSEVEEEYTHLEEKYFDLKNSKYPKLLVLSLYYGCQNFVEQDS